MMILVISYEFILQVKEIFIPKSPMMIKNHVQNVALIVWNLSIIYHTYFDEKLNV